MLLFLHKVSKVFTLFTTVTTVILYGLLFAIPLGGYQLILFLYLIFSKQVKTEGMKPHLVTYAVLASIVLLSFPILARASTLLLLPLMGLVLAWYQVWITSQLVLVNSVFDKEALIVTEEQGA